MLLTNYIVLFSISVNFITNVSIYHPSIYEPLGSVFSSLNAVLLFFAHTSNWFSGELTPEGRWHKNPVSIGGESSSRGSFRSVVHSCSKVFFPYQLIQLPNMLFVWPCCKRSWVSNSELRIASCAVFVCFGFVCLGFLDVCGFSCLFFLID